MCWIFDDNTAVHTSIPITKLLLVLDEEGSFSFPSSMKDVLLFSFRAVCKRRLGNDNYSLRRQSKCEDEEKIISEASI